MILRTYEACFYPNQYKMIHTSIKICVFIQDEVLVDGEKGSAAAAAAAASSPPPLPGGDRQLMAVCTDKGAVVYALPSHRVIYNQVGEIVRKEGANSIG